jgi:hypothetical protein
LAGDLQAPLQVPAERYRCPVATASGSGDARAVRSGDLSGGIEFALDSFDVVDEQLVVAGRWFGITGRRFVRPVLQAPGQRRVIALLDHKPWPADDGVPWLAAFPYDGYRGRARLQVAPDIAVELPAAGPEAGDGTPRPARLARTPAPRRSPGADPAPAERAPAARPAKTTRERQDARRLAVIEAERGAASAEIEAIRQERDRARADADGLRSEVNEARRDAERLRTERDHARTDAGRLEAELGRVRAEADALRAGRDDARTKLDRLEADIARLRADADRATAERNSAQQEAERLRRTPGSQPYIAPRPMAFRDTDPGPSWQLRAVAAFAVAAAFVLLFRLLGLL